MAFKPIRFKVAGYEPVGTISTIAHLLKPSPALNSFKTRFYTSAFWIKRKLVWGIWKIHENNAPDINWKKSKSTKIKIKDTIQRHFEYWLRIPQSQSLNKNRKINRSNIVQKRSIKGRGVAKSQNVTGASKGQQYEGGSCDLRLFN